MMFDFDNKTQEFWDPWGEVGSAPLYTNAFSQRESFLLQLCPRVLTVQQLPLPQMDRSLQPFLQYSPAMSDLCTACCFAVIFLYLRFGIVRLHLCAQLIREAYLGNTPARNTFIKRFIKWCNTFLVDDAAAQIDIPQIVLDDDNRCAIVSKSTGRLCRRKRCGNQLYCWQHRYFWQNPFAADPHRMACAAPFRNQNDPAAGGVSGGLPANFLD